MKLKLYLFPIILLYTTLLIAQKVSSFSSSTLMGKTHLEFYSEEIPLLKEAGEAFQKMQIAARKDGIEIEIVSAYRSYERQKGIWNRKYSSNAKKGLNPQQNIKKIIEYSTLPGTSRHHWGTDVDIIDANQPSSGDVLLTEKFHRKGPYAPLRKWMDKHAATYGFIRPYTQDPKRKGFYYEPWHYSYAPLSVPMLKAYLKLNINSLLDSKSLEGNDYITPEFLSLYIDENILGIDPRLK